jgi:hypothetical protein
MEILDKLKEIVSKMSLEADDYNMNLAYNNVLFVINQIQKEENGTKQGIDSGGNSQGNNEAALYRKL